jgi:hypothetical protein
MSLLKVVLLLVVQIGVSSSKHFTPLIVKSLNIKVNNVFNAKHPRWYVQHIQKYQPYSHNQHTLVHLFYVIRLPVSAEGATISPVTENREN